MMHLSELESRIPSLPASSLVDFASNIVVVDDHIEYRSRRKFFGRYLDAILGKNTRRQNHIDRSLKENQETLFRYAESLLDRQLEGDVALKLTQEKLLETRRFTRRLSHRIDVNEERIEVLVSRFDDFATKVNHKLSSIEKSVRRLNALDVVVSAVDGWQSGRTYYGLPPVIQLYLLASEVIERCGSLLLSDYALRQEVRQRWIDRCVVAMKESQDVVTLRHLLREEVGLLSDNDDTEVSLALIDPRGIAPSPTPAALMFCLGTALELRTSMAASNNECSKLAIELSESNGLEVQRTYSPRELVTTVFDERVGQIEHYLPVAELS